jgi:hypothetical protein
MHPVPINDQQAKRVFAKKHSILSRTLFCVGFGLILIIQICVIDFTYTDWSWNRSFFAHFLFWPLLILAIVCCSAAPFFVKGSFWRRGSFSVFAGLSAVGFYFLTSFLILLLYGV